MGNLFLNLSLLTKRLLQRGAQYPELWDTLHHVQGFAEAVGTAIMAVAAIKSIVVRLAFMMFISPNVLN